MLKKIFQGETGEKIIKHENELSGHKSRVTSLGFFKDKLYTGSQDCTIRQWEPVSGACYSVLKGHQAPIQSMVISEDGTLFSGSHDAKIISWGAERQLMLKVFSGHLKGISCLFLKDNELFSGSFDHTIRRWNTSTGMTTMMFQGHTDTITGIHVDVYSTSSASSEITSTKKKNEGEDGEDEEEEEEEEQKKQSLKYLFSSSADNTVRMWSLQDGSCITQFMHHTGWVWDFVLTKNYIYSAGMDGLIVKWKKESFGSGSPLKVLSNHSDCVCRLQLANFGSNNYLISSGWDGLIKIFSLSKKEDTCIRTLSGHSGKVTFLLVFGKLLFSAATKDNNVRIWDWTVGKCKFILENGKPITGICFGETFETIFVSSNDGTIRKYSIPESKLTKGLKVQANLLSKFESSD